MKYHQAPGHAPVPCHLETSGRCRICELTEPSSPHYREDYRRLYHPEEFGGPAQAQSPPEIPIPTATTAARPLPDIPLAGDVVEAIARRIGADRLARLWEDWTGKPCGCEERKERLNAATEKLLKWARRLGVA